MADSLDTFRRVLYHVGEQQRWIQHSPILPNVWKTFIEHPGKQVDLLVTPYRETRPAQLAAAIRQRLAAAAKATESEIAIKNNVAHNQSMVAVSVTFDQLIRDLMPLSDWYQKYVVQKHWKDIQEYSKLTKRSKKLKQLLEVLNDPESPTQDLDPTAIWWIRLIGFVSLCQEGDCELDADQVWERALALVKTKNDHPERLFRIALNRSAETACVDSVQAIKGDAAIRVFDVKTDRICWAILDSGIDARHPAFFDEEKKTRVKETYDFTRVRQLIALASAPGDDAAKELKKTFGISVDDAMRIRTSLSKGGEVDWETLRPALRVDHKKSKSLDKYAEDLNPHGTHVAGILAGRRQDKADGESDFVGVCPDIRLIDIRILDKDGSSGARRGEPEFNIIAALQFVGHLNAVSDNPVVHGVNLSIQLRHDPKDFACGRTPVCEECNRLSASGVIVVAAAGNMGIDTADLAANTTVGAFRDISIADPGNADSVITVGSTHRKRPHTYGVSFFSSRGPTGDGRSKPDLVAPGEKILGPVVDGGYEEMQGTSQAAPHVSGAAAMILARHSELIGDPGRVKEILCGTATDLGRERHFQGAGLVDILRALQSI